MKPLVQWSLVGLASWLCLSLIWEIRQTPSFNDVRTGPPGADRAILDRHGRVLDEVRAGSGQRRLNWTPLNETTADFRSALLLAQDRRFYFHPGIDLLAWGRATLTMQLSDLLRPEPALGAGVILRAIALEMKWSKAQILEAFVNLAPYRQELRGVSVASYALFDKAPPRLTRGESAVIAALANQPERLVAAVGGRACRLLQELDSPENCALIGADHLRAIDRGFAIRPFARLAPHLNARLKDIDEKGPLVRSTIDRALQWRVLDALQASHAQDGAAIVIDNESGEVLAYVGAINGASRADRALRKFAAGATLLPLLYAQGLDERVITAATTFPEGPTRKALHSRSALSAVRILEWVGTGSFAETLEKLGFTDLNGVRLSGPSLALGAFDVNLSELANAYRAIANGGLWSPIRFSPDQVTNRPATAAFTKGAAFVLDDLLRTNDAADFAQVDSGGVGEDRFFVGYNDRVTVGVRGRESAWREIQEIFIKKNAPARRLAPEGLARLGDEWFLMDTRPVDARSRSWIAYPHAGGWIAQDREVIVQIVAPRSDQNLFADGKRLGRAQARMKWTPDLGNHKLELRDSRGQVLHKVEIEVRDRRFALRSP